MIKNNSKLNIKENGLPKIGEAINLLSLLHKNQFGFNEFKKPEETALKQFELNEFSKNSFTWDPLQVTVHNGVESLLDQVALYKVCPLFSEDNEYKLSPDMFGETIDNYFKQYENDFKINLKKDSYYMLFELSRIKIQAEHEVTAQPSRAYFDRDTHLTNDWKVKSRQLRPGTRVQENDEHDTIVSVSQSQKYLESFYNYGTHFISAIEIGDKLLQVIELKDHIGKQTYEYWNELGKGKAVMGTEALHFKFFTGENFAETVGDIVSFGKDHGLADITKQGLWEDSNSITGNSLMAIFNADERLIKLLNSKLTLVIPIKIELTSLARFMEYFRAINFQKILKGALIQRWGTIVQSPIRRMTKTIDRIDLKVLNETRSFCFDDNNFIYGDKITEQDFHTAKLNKKNINSCHRILSLHETLSLQDIRPNILTQLLDSNSLSNKASSLLLSDTDFDNVPIVCQQMDGILILKNSDESKKDTIVNGLRFSSIKEDDSELKIFIKEDIHKIDLNKIEILLPCIYITLINTQAKLACPKTNNTQREEVVSFVKWIATLLSSDSEIKNINKLHLFASHLSDVESIEVDYSIIFDEDVLTIVYKYFIQIATIITQPEFSIVGRILDFKDEKELFTIKNFIKIREYQIKLSESYLSMLNQLHQALKDKMKEFDLSLNLAKEKVSKGVNKYKETFNNNAVSPSCKVLFEGILSGIAGFSFTYNNEELRDHYDDESVTTASDFANHENIFYVLFRQMDSINILYNNFNSGKIKYNVNLLDQLPKSHERKIPEPFCLSKMRKTFINSGAIFPDEKEIDVLLSLWDDFEKERIRNLKSKECLLSLSLEFGYLSIPDEEINFYSNTSDINYKIDLECFKINTVLNKIVRLQEAAASYENIYIPKNLEHINNTSITYLINALNTALAEFFNEKKISQQN
ncbi:hypothetical protein [Flavobacterium cerinum]|uniref:MACPF domain-containing protein n=1 Tax=Flavobacterium cerinum TaxID=2502784 RepID=A0A444GL57_9FLAO|nr:hypothetical protein [Flavobacterium cerinum]RWW91707.1 hypothetical protein EPI11_18225 [Flavobacterium cerinum]